MNITVEDEINELEAIDDFLEEDMERGEEYRMFYQQIEAL